MIDAVALVMLGALVAYALAAGADFGGGVWDMFARGPRAAAQRQLIEHAIGPIWEANHVWLILVVVLLFTGFPRAYAVASVALHVPLTLMLLGIVARGSAFVFRHYSRSDEQLRWGRVFAIASVATPLFLGVVLGAITAGVPMVDGVPVGGFFRPWLRPFPVSVGVLALALFAFLAAVYLTVEAGGAAGGEADGEGDLREDFRRRALVAGAAVGLSALGCGLSAATAAPAFVRALIGSWWSWPLQIATGATAAGVWAALIFRRWRWARRLAAAQVALIVVGWGLAQRPYLIAPDVTLTAAAAPPRTLALLLGALAAGALLLFPSLWFLYRVFKQKPIS